MLNLLDPLGADRKSLEEIFKELAQGNTILFLGAGASITNKKYLSQQLIEYYEDRIGKSLGINNITEFIDIASENEWFSRSEFDAYVYDLLSNLRLTTTHETILTIPWRAIITTNFDLLLERAEQENAGSSNKLYELVKVRSLNEFRHFCDNTQIKYIKLNGCMSDRSAYPFKFSTDDFRIAKPFYKTVLDELKSLSDKIKFLAVGYSFSDSFASQLLERLDKFNYRDKKWIYNVDPYPDEFKIPYYNKKRILTIKCTCEEFFKEYKKWEEGHYKIKLKTSQGVTFTNSKDLNVNIGYKLAHQLKGVVNQLNDRYTGRFITEEKFYRGEEPNYHVITKGYDIQKRRKIEQVKKKIQDIVTDNHSLIPIIFLTGNFGTGKTTFNYRIIHEFVNDRVNDATAFEILEIDIVRRECIKELIEAIKSKILILYSNDIEVDSVFKSLIELRAY